MKYLVIFALISLAAACLLDDINDGKITEIENTCQKEHGVLNAELKGLLTNKTEPHNVKCMRACILKKLDVMNFYGKIRKTSAKKTLVFLLKQSATNEVAGKIIDTCNALELSSDHCEAAFEHANCIKTELESKRVSAKLI